MSRGADVVLPFGGEDRAFRLPIGRLRALDEKRDCGPMELLRRIATGEWRVEDLRETIYQALQGGGMDSASATSLMKAEFDDQPLGQFVSLAQAIITAAIIGVPEEPLGGLAGEDQPNRPSPDESSGSQTSTEPGA